MASKIVTHEAMGVYDPTADGPAPFPAFPGRRTPMLVLQAGFLLDLGTTCGGKALFCS